MPEFDHYYIPLAAAFVRGRQLQGAALGLPGSLLHADLDLLSDHDLQAILRQGAEAGLRLHKFKRTGRLPRVGRVLGILRALAPMRLLDIGSGRGTFLWPLLDAFPLLDVSAVDRNPSRVRDLQAVHLGGVARLTASEMDATHLDFDHDAFELVTMLEVLEHISDAPAAVAESVRVASRFVIASVPSKADNNPEHLHLFDQATLQSMFLRAGAQRVSFEHVLGHLIAVARTAGP